jgi:hypothetical protein
MPTPEFVDLTRRLSEPAVLELLAPSVGRPSPENLTRQEGSIWPSGSPSTTRFWD